MVETAGRPKIAILGSGVGAMTAAYELAIQDKYDITVYQMGWRHGGQGASGRNMSDHGRIEEHGLHVWFGFYENAFSLMRRCYADVNRPPGAPLATVQQAFVGHDTFMFRETFNGVVHPWRIDFPSDPMTFPGSLDKPPLPDMNEVVKRLLENAVGYFATGLADRMPLVPASHPLLAGLSHFVAAIDHSAQAMSAEVGRILFDHAMLKLDAGTSHEWDALAELLVMFRALVAEGVRPFLGFDESRRAFILVDLLLTIAIGMLRDRVLAEGFDVINDKDFREWLESHGGDALSYNGPLIQALYDVFFAYDGGDVGRPSVEAGLALRGSLRTILTYQGHVLWKMNAGMGDTIFAPLYLALKKRGVTFKFFHRVERLAFDEERGAISAIDIARQVDLAVDEYAPLIDVEGLPCWPNAPLADQIVNGQALKDVNLESRWSGWQDAGHLTLHEGADFDQVILGITIAGLPFICDEKLLALDAWRKMLSAVKTVRTQAVQLWFNRTSEDLGMSVPGGIIADCSEPDACWADFVQVLDRERWPDGGAKGLFYGCGVLSDDGPEFPPPDDREFPAQQLARVHATTVAFLQQSAAQIWPQAILNGGLDWNALLAPSNLLGSDRVYGQYLRANVDPSERYVLSVVGSTQFRLRADGSGVKNLFLVGSWIDNGFNLSCVEAAVMSGMQASRGISGQPAEVYGENGFPKVRL
jgi:uncharacterized protein with NAD-binding domain and iron-sulfur cluster